MGKVQRFCVTIPGETKSIGVWKERWVCRIPWYGGECWAGHEKCRHRLSILRPCAKPQIVLNRDPALCASNLRCTVLTPRLRGTTQLRRYFLALPNVSTQNISQPQPPPLTATSPSPVSPSLSHVRLPSHHGSHLQDRPFSTRPS